MRVISILYTRNRSLKNEDRTLQCSLWPVEGGLVASQLQGGVAGPESGPCLMDKPSGQPCSHATSENACRVENKRERTRKREMEKERERERGGGGIGGQMDDPHQGKDPP